MSKKRYGCRCKADRMSLAKVCTAFTEMTAAEKKRGKKRRKSEASHLQQGMRLCWREGLKIGDRRISSRAGKYDSSCPIHRCQGVWKKDENNFYITYNTILHIKYY
jgi:hypothetical protein